MSTPTSSPERAHALLLALAALSAGAAAAIALTVAAGAPAVPSARAWVGAGALLALGAGVVALRRRSAAPTGGEGEWAIAALLAATATFAVLSLAHFAGFLRIPADLLSFSESPFVDDIIKIRLGLPIYTPIPDNNSYPYTPGTQLLTYTIARLLGHPTSVPVFRTVQFGYVILAALVAAAAGHQLARGFLRPEEYRYRPLWIAVWVTVLLLLVNEPSFNPYTHTLHNDGLALLLSMCAFWLIARHHAAPAAWLLAPMAVLPALGFMVKQNQLLWAGVFGIYLLASGKASWRQLALYAAMCAAAVGTAVGGSILLWGEEFRYWIFSALGDKQVSVLRSARHLLAAGLFGVMGLWAGRVLVLPQVDRGRVAVWGSWALVFSIQAYTSGIGFVTNHLGPGIVMAGVWFLVALVRVWPRPAPGLPEWRTALERAGVVAAIVLLLGGMGLVQQPGRSVPRDLDRYIAALEREFEDLPVATVLQDVGSWVYLRHGVLMRDRSGPVSLHVGANQPEINRAALAQTIARIESGRYRRLLVRELDTPRSAYDFHDRGSGVKDAILANYRVVRRIPGVEVSRWWPRHMIADVLVMEPK